MKGMSPALAALCLVMLLPAAPLARTAGTLSIAFEAGDYRVIEGHAGQRIEMDGFGSLIEPGKPVLPRKNFLIALPPGARAHSVRILGVVTSRVTGTYRIEPAPRIRPLEEPGHTVDIEEELRREWESHYEAAYLTDKAYPPEIAWLAGVGGLRKYSYASVAFVPLSYHPQSGRLYIHHEVRVAVDYTLPDEGSREALRISESMRDDVADGKASRLFVNYQDIEGMYQPEGSGPMALEETHDYVIITASNLLSAITSSNFPAWKTLLGYNLRTVLVTDTEITSQPGTDLAEQIRNFLRSYYTAWGIEYVLFVGNYATVPMRISYPHPDLHAYNPGDPWNPGGGTPTDLYYADLSLPDSVSWDSDRDGYLGEYSEDNPDFLAEVSVGRIPTDTLARITYALNKLVAFEEDTGAWKNHALHCGAILAYENQDFGGTPVVDGATVLDSIETALMGGWTVSHYSEQEGLAPSVFPWPALSEAAFSDDWRTGEYGVVNWAGHGFCSAAARVVWVTDDGDGVPETDGSDTINSIHFIGTATSNLDDDHPSIVFAISCSIGYPEPNPYGRCGVDLLIKPGWGSSAGVVSASRGAAASLDWKTYGAGAEGICYHFNRYYIVENERLGDAFYDSKFYCNSNYGWDHYYEYKNMFGYNLYGDPALEFRGISAGVDRKLPVADRDLVCLAQNTPNPFRYSTAIQFSLPRRQRVRLTVHDVEGRQVAVLADGHFDAGCFAAKWNGTDDSGRTLSPGIYFLRLEAGRVSTTSKMVLMR